MPNLNEKKTEKVFRKPGKTALRTRAALLDAAIELLKEKSLHDISVEEICQKANSSIGSFYYSFESKNNIYAHIYTRYNDDLEEAYSKTTFSSPDEAIRFLVTEQIKGSAQYGVGFASHIFALQLGSIDDENHVFTDTKSKRFFLPKKLLEQVTRLCALKDCSTDPSIITSDIIRSSRGVIFDWSVQNGAFDIYEKGLHHLDMILFYYGLA